MPEEKKDGKKQEQPGRGLYDWAQALVCSVLAGDAAKRRSAAGGEPGPLRGV